MEGISNSLRLIWRWEFDCAAKHACSYATKPTPNNVLKYYDFLPNTQLVKDYFYFESAIDVKGIVGACSDEACSLVAE